MESNTTATRLKQRLARVFRPPPFLLHSSCNPSTSPSTNLTSTPSSRALLRDAVAEPVFVPHSNNLQSRPDQDLHDTFFRSLSLATPINNNDNQCRRRRAFHLTGACRPIRPRKIPSVIAKNSKWKITVGDGRTCPPASPSTSPSKAKTARKKTIRKKKKKKLHSNACGFTSSSSMAMISDDELGFFSTEEEEEDEEDGVLKERESETFFSSRSFSSDSSEFYRNPNKKKKKKKKVKGKKTKSISEEWGLCKEFQPLEKTKEEEEEIRKKGFAVKKKSSDPYSDFRSSMVEMIIERQIFGSEDLERLLESYLSLNSIRHHPIILQAFSDIWVVLFDH